jgi:Bacterial capsule synthesis protein PGA_cap
MSEGIVLLGCGDVGPIHEPMKPYSELVRDTLAVVDIRFAQIERTYSERGELRAGSGGSHGRLPPHMASVIIDCGFNVASLAGNHGCARSRLSWSRRQHGIGTRSTASFCCQTCGWRSERQ